LRNRDEDLPDRLGTGIFDSVGVCAIQTQLRQSRGTCRNDLSVGELDLRAGQEDFIPYAESPLHCRFQRQRKGVTSLAGRRSSAHRQQDHYEKL
jgi:hypothetical protein